MGFSIVILLCVLVAAPVFFLPSIIALINKHPYKIPIILINIFGGLCFGVGWLVALVWCFIRPKEGSSLASVAYDLERLHQLKEKGVLTEEEFNTKKQGLLKP